MNTHDRSRRRTPRQTATIHSLAAHLSGRDPNPTRPDDRDTVTTNPPPNTDCLVFTVDEATYLLNISRSLAYELIARGEPPALRLGRRIVIPRVTLEELLGTSTR